MGLCKLPWNDIEPADNHVRYRPQDAARAPWSSSKTTWTSSTLSRAAIVKEDLITMAERVCNFQRLFQVRMKHGNAEHTIPARAMGPVFPDEWDARKEYYDDKLREAGIAPEGLSTHEKIERLYAHRMKQWADLKDAVYKRRGWNKKGIPTEETLKNSVHRLPRSGGGGAKAQPSRRRVLKIHGHGQRRELPWHPGMTVQQVIDAKRYTFRMLAVWVNDVPIPGALRRPPRGRSRPDPGAPHDLRRLAPGKAGGT